MLNTKQIKKAYLSSQAIAGDKKALQTIGYKDQPEINSVA